MQDHPVPGHPSRRSFLATTGGAALAGALLSAAPAGASTASPLSRQATAAHDEVAAIFNHALLLHTNWVESQWDASAGYFTATNYSFISVLGNAVLLKYGEYDASVAGVSADTLHEQTVATIAAFAANNVLNGGSVWGETEYFDGTYEVYFGLAAKLLWDDLDAATQANVTQMMTGQANYTLAIGTGNDPRSPGWTTNGLAGGYVGDTKIDEMAVPAQCLAPALAWYPGDANAASWAHWLDVWLLNDTGLPPADQANPFVVDGAPISQWNTAQNIYDTFIVENHGSFEPHYQEETWRMSGRVAAHFMAAGQPVPLAVTAKPNGRQLWATIRRTMSNSGEPFNLMDNDRYHLFGRDVIPLTFLAQVTGDRDAARAEAMLASQLIPYVLYPPEYQLTKFSGQPSYEPEARAELGICYLFHLWRRQHSGGPVAPVSEEKFFAAAAGATDYGSGPGLLAQSSATAFAATVTKPGFVKCVYVPGHDDWLFNVSGATPFLVPTTGVTVHSRSAVAYNALRDGFDGTAAVLTLQMGSGGFGYTGFATLPTGTAVYATTGTGSGEGTVSVFNMDMPGVPGLDGQRTYTGADGAVTIGSAEVPGPGTAAFTFPAVTARYVRMQGVTPGTIYGYSIFEFSVYAPGSSTDLALNQPTTASSYDTLPPQLATDGDPATRWAVAIADRSDPNSWLEVDLGAPVEIGAVTVIWETAYGAAYDIQVSTDGTTWTNVVVVPEQRSFTGNWLNVDSRVGFVVSGSTNPITVSATQLTLSDGPASGAAGMVVEAYASHSPAQTSAAAARSRPSGGPAGLAASSADGYLSLFNLTGAAISQQAITVPQDGKLLLYRGTQSVVSGGTSYEVSLDAATAAVEPPRFTLSSSAQLPAGLQVTVADSHHVTVAAPAGGPAVHATLTSCASAEQRQVTVKPGQTVSVVFRKGSLTPSPNLALGRTTFPTSPLPRTMTDPALAVDGDPATAWRPGPAGRMVVDLGSQLSLAAAELTWHAGDVPAADISVSTDGLAYASVGATVGGPGQQAVTIGTSARYVAVSVPGWRQGSAELTEISVTAPE